MDGRVRITLALDWFDASQGGGALRSLSEYGWIMPSAATHALTVGAAGGLTIGMMTRTRPALI